jgi:hypothetical protein
MDLNNDYSAGVNENHKKKQQMVAAMMLMYVRGTQSSATSKRQRSSIKTLRHISVIEVTAFPCSDGCGCLRHGSSTPEVLKKTSTLDITGYRVSLYTEIHPASWERVRVCADRAVSMTHPLNYFHSWAVNEGFDLAPFSLRLWATVSLFYSPWPEPDSSYVVQ